LETKSVRSDDNKIELTVTLSDEEVKKQIDAAYKQAGKVRIPGFRPGKAPRKILENFYGGKEYFLAEATDSLVKESLPLAVDAEGHVPLDKPEVAEIDPVEEGKSYSYSFKFTVRPVLELSSYEPLQIELPSSEPTEEEVNEQIDVMLNYYADMQDITDRAAKAEDVVTMDIELTNGEERVEAMSGEKIPYQLGGGVMPQSFDDKLVGAKIDKPLEFDLDLSAEERVPNFLNKEKPVHAKVTITGIQARIKPELTDEFAKETLEFESAEDFRSQIAETLKFRKTADLASLKENVIAQELAARLEGEPTEVLVSQTEQELYRDFFNSLQQSGQSFDTFLTSANITSEVFREDIKKQAIEVASQALALDAFARHLALEVTEEELRHEFEISGVEDPDALYKQWQENGRLSEIREGVLRMKVSKQINEEAEVFEPGKKPAVKKAAAKKPAAKKDGVKKGDADGAADTAKATDKKDSKASTKGGAKATKESKAKKSAKVDE
jgi:trigger factor